MKKKSKWGGARKGSGRKPNKKTGSKDKWLGLRWSPDELADVLAALEQAGIKNKSLFVVKSTLKAARNILNKEVTMDLQLKYQELFRVTQNLMNFIEDNKVKDSVWVRGEDGTWKSSEFQDVITEVLLVINNNDSDKTCTDCAGFDNEVCAVRGLELYDYTICNEFELDS